jgi:hypothetical protein
MMDREEALQGDFAPFIAARAGLLWRFVFW